MADQWKKRAEAEKDKAKGKIKAVAGKATGDRRLELEGEFEQAKGKTKEGVEKAKRKLGR